MIFIRLLLFLPRFAVLTNDERTAADYLLSILLNHRECHRRTQLRLEDQRDTRALLGNRDPFDRAALLWNGHGKFCRLTCALTGILTKAFAADSLEREIQMHGKSPASHRQHFESLLPRF